MQKARHVHSVTVYFDGLFRTLPSNALSQLLKNKIKQNTEDNNYKKPRTSLYPKHWFGWVYIYVKLPLGDMQWSVHPGWEPALSHLCAQLGVPTDALDPEAVGCHTEVPGS